MRIHSVDTLPQSMAFKQVAHDGSMPDSSYTKDSLPYNYNKELQHLSNVRESLRRLNYTGNEISPRLRECLDSIVESQQKLILQLGKLDGQGESMRFESRKINKLA